MGRRACCVKMGLKKGTWTAAEDEILVDYIKKNGHGCWRSLPKHAGFLSPSLLRCGKSCRLRWTNYLNPDIKRGPLSREEEKLVIQLHGNLGNSWAAIASQLPGRTDNEIKNLWNTHLKKRLLCMGIDPQTHSPSSISNGRNTKPPASPSTSHMAQSESARLEAEAPRSRGSLPVNPPSLGKTSSDHFLRTWNSELGESFQNFHNGNKTACQILGSQSSSSSTKCGSVSYTTLEMGAPLTGSSAAGNSQNEVLKCADDSSDTAFLDFLGNVDSFLECNDNYALFPTILSESSLNCSP